MRKIVSDPRVAEFIHRVINLEQGYVDHPHDKGGPTKYGITQAVARKHGFKGAIADLTREDAFNIYAKSYWKKPKLDRLAKYSEAVAWEVFDTGINCGTGTGIKFLQRSLSAFNGGGMLYPDLVADGVIGKKTLNALEQYFMVRKGPTEGVLLKALNCLQGAHYLHLAELREHNETFVFGWINKRIELRGDQ